MKRVVLDTNILIQALIRPQGITLPLIVALRSGSITVLYSAGLIEELVDVASRPRIRGKYGLQPEDIEALIGLVQVAGERVQPGQEIQVCRDPDDDHLLEVAIAGQANFIVTGDEDLLVLNPFRGVVILSLSNFLAQL